MVTTYLDAIKPVRALAENEVQSHEGGIVFVADKWTRLKRFLILGSEGTFYATGHDLTIENVAVVRECLDDYGIRTVVEIRDTSMSGIAPKNEPAILALAIASMHDDQLVRQVAFLNLHQVCRTGTHLLHFAAYREALGGGWGRGMRRAVGKWFSDKAPRDLAYQAVKYQQRDGWSLADLLRLSHPKPSSFWHSRVMKYIVDGAEAVTDKAVWLPMAVGGIPDDSGGAFDFLMACAALGEYEKSEAGAAAQLIRKDRIPREAVPTEMLNSPEVWAALLDDMPMTAMIRNLGKMTSVGLIDGNNGAAFTVCGRLRDVDRLKKARVHPIALLAALKVYEQGHGEKGSLKWMPSKSVINALDESFYLAFGAVESTGKRIRLALDVSGSMDGNKVNGMPFLTAREASAAMALVTAAVEPDAHFVAYSTRLIGVNIQPSMRLDEVMRTLRAIPMGGTYCSLPIFDAIVSGAQIDAFVSYTDSETWDGGNRGYGFFVNPSMQYFGSQPEQPPAKTANECLVEYRLRSGIPARHAVCAFASNGFSLADPNDPGQMDFVGLDASMPHILAGFMKGEV